MKSASESKEEDTVLDDTKMESFDDDIDGVPLDSSDDTMMQKSIKVKSNKEEKEDDVEKEITQEESSKKVILDEEELKKKEDRTVHPYLGKKVKIIHGKYLGLESRISNVGSRGWWSLDHPKILSGEKVHSRLCEMIDVVEEEELRAYYEKMGMKMRRTPAMMKRQQENAEKGSKLDSDNELDLEQGYRSSSSLNEYNPKKRASSPKLALEEQSRPSKRKSRPVRALMESSNIFEFEETKNDDASGKRKRSARRQATEFSGGVITEEDYEDYDPIVRPSTTKKRSSTVANEKTTKSNFRSYTRPRRKRKAVQNFGSYSDELYVDQIIGKPKNPVNHTQNQYHSVKARPKASKSVDVETRTERHQTIEIHPQLRPPSIDALPPLTLANRALRALPPNTKIEIFDRKTGLVLSGDQAVPVSHLPLLLRNHAHYEPIIPAHLLPKDVVHKSRIGRSASNIRVNSNVTPQSRKRRINEGRSVFVIGGQYQGYMGKISSFVSGGWYLVSGIQCEPQLDVAISSSNLELLPEETFPRNLIPQNEQKEKTNHLEKVHQSATIFQKIIFDELSIPLKSIKLKLKSLDQEKNTLKTQLKYLHRHNIQTSLRQPINAATTKINAQQNVMFIISAILSDLVHKVELRHEPAKSSEEIAFLASGMKQHQVRKQMDKCDRQIRILKEQMENLLQIAQNTKTQMQASYDGVLNALD